MNALTLVYPVRELPVSAVLIAPHANAVFSVMMVHASPMRETIGDASVKMDVEHLSLNQNLASSITVKGRRMGRRVMILTYVLLMICAKLDRVRAHLQVWR